MIVTKKEIIETVEKRRKGKKVGFILGSFDVLHAGHLNLFQRAKENCDILVVGLDSDYAITATKGPNRPVNRIDRRLEFLNELKSIDYVFPMEQTMAFNTEDHTIFYFDFIQQLKPDYVFAYFPRSPFMARKVEYAQKHGIPFNAVNIGEDKEISSTSIVTHG